ncbi:type II toxin-antitoxin system HicB family antitoxin [Candidatus Daviesbacteria bacterium]|nr:type II toxin-antitoxin system HicB family antitoxin [Candidatus Daviesbacteria bacterium]
MIKRSKDVSEYELPIKLELQKDGGYVAISPVWSDCYAQGDTIDEAILEITAVAQSLIELYKEEGLEIPLKLQKKKESGNNSFSVPVFVAS